ncbi:hypothetical protein [Bacteroides gallinarum]|uniref:hypothetical protein n=1 Tax=Bacteroides gallinarum TaxID=376806 RepID=UPI00035D29D4|nr:hypothetical protein [Bacteroides gallinarum]
MDIIDGLEAFKGLFPSEDELIKHILKHTLFFEKEAVRKQAINLRTNIRMGQAVPVRYTSNTAFFLQHKVKTTTPNFKGRSEAVRFTDNPENALFHKETKIRICFDRDGNYYPKQMIFNSTKYKVSCGAQSNIINYIIAHIWDKTDNPLYFGLLWNYCLIPAHCAFITDKKEESNTIVKQTKNLLKAISLELYNPNRIMDWNQSVIQYEDMPEKEYISKARKLIKENQINFLHPRKESI